MQESDEDIQAGFLIFMPLYMQGMPTNTVIERRSHLYGWVTAVFRMNDLMAGIGHLHTPTLAFDIYNADDTAAEARMFTSENTHATEETSGFNFESIRKLNIADRTWTVVIRSTPLFETRLNSYLPVIIASTGINRASPMNWPDV